MPFLRDLNMSAKREQEQLDSVVKQLNEWGRLVSNENLTRIIKSDAGVEAMKIGLLENNAIGLQITDESGIPRALFGQLPDGTIGIVISEEGTSVFDVF